MASFLTFDADGAAEVDNGVAYGLVAGGSSSFIVDDHKWFVGNNYTAYLLLMHQHEVDPSVTTLLMSARSSVLHGKELNELPNLEAVAGGGGLLITAAEALSDAQVAALISFEGLSPYHTNVLYRNATTAGVAALVAAHQAANAGVVPTAAEKRAMHISVTTAGNAAYIVPPNAPWHITRLPDELRETYTSVDMIRFGNMVARMSYSALVTTGANLTVLGHHSQGFAVKVMLSCFALYEVVALLKTLGLKATTAATLLAHDAFHPLPMRGVALNAISISAGVRAKCAGQVSKRFPLFPTGTGHIKHGASCINAMWADPRCAAIVSADHEMRVPIHARADVESAVRWVADDDTYVFNCAQARKAAILAGGDVALAVAAIVTQGPFSARSLAFAGASAREVARVAIPEEDDEAGLLCIIQMKDMIALNPMDYSGLFGGAGLAANLLRVTALDVKCCFVFGMYDAYSGWEERKPGEGPTFGKGVARLVGEGGNLAAYARGYRAMKLAFAGAVGEASPMEIFAGLG